MNTDKLHEIVDRIFEVEGTVSTRPTLENLASSLSSLAGDPQDANHQNQMASDLQDFVESMAHFKDAFSPQDYGRVLELSEGAFSLNLVEEIQQSVQANVMSPNVATELAQQRCNEREEVFLRLAEMQSALKYFEFGYVEAERNQAEVGFEIPRELFDDNLDGLIKELTDIRRMVRVFSEAALGKYEPVRVSSISTTDPLVFVVMAALAVKCVASSAEWAIGVWRSVEEIRNLRAQTAQLESFTLEEAETIFGTKIKEEVDAKVKEKVNELIKENKITDSRKGELASRLDWALNTLLAKTERGMIIELRIPPPPADGNEEADNSAGEDVARQELLDIQKQLVFPEASEDPILHIPKYGGGSD